MHSTSSTEEEESNELERFRQEWLAELRNRKAAKAKATKDMPVTTTGREEIDSFQESSSETAWTSTAWTSPGTATPREPVGSSTPSIGSTQSKVTSSTHLAANPLPRRLGHALTIYRRAVQHEQNGNFDKALNLYRQAFRRDPHVDRVYHREEALASISAAQRDPLQKSTVPEVDGSVNELTTKTHASLTIKPRDIAHTLNVRSQILVNILKGFPDDISFKPENEEEPMPLGDVPDELLVLFLTKLDTTSIERFAAVSRKARVIALESVIWRELVGTTYQPPQVDSDQELTKVLEQYLYDYRRMYIEHPRVRLDGVYIATCHYVRPGLSDNSWVNVDHLITYHRYLRFYPDGQALSLLTNEEFAPKQVVSLLKPTLRMKGFFVGTWRLKGTTIEISNLLDASGRFPLPTDDPSAHDHTSVIEGNRYTFIMTLDLISRPLGRWNKMHLKAYDSVQLETGEVNPVALKNERPFHFSKVRSYSVY